MNLKKIGNVFTSNFVGTGPSTYEKSIYRAAVSQRLRNTGLHEIQYESCKIPVGSDVLGAVTMKVNVCRQVAPYSLADSFERFR